MNDGFGIAAIAAVLIVLCVAMTKGCATTQQQTCTYEMVKLGTYSADDIVKLCQR